MPHGRNGNHKGLSRQFTPVDQLQQELEEGLKIARSQVSISKSPTHDDSSSANEEENPKRPVGGSHVHCLIEISNPNRPADPNAMKRMALQKLNEVPLPFRDRTGRLNRQEREGKRAQALKEEKTTQVKCDLARLALIRQEREAAAQKRMALAAKSTTLPTKMFNTKENNPNAVNDNTKKTKSKRNRRSN